MAGLGVGQSVGVTMERDLSVSDIAALTGYGHKRICSLAHQGKIPGAYRIGRRWLFNRQAIERMRGGGVRGG